MNELDAILDGDFVVALAQVTPLRGVVLAPVNSLGWDADSRTFAFTSDLAAFRKLRRLERNPRVTVVFHAREHGTARGEDFVLVQGEASFSWHPNRDELRPFYRRPGTALGPDNLGGPLWNWWLGPFFWDRVVVRVKAHRVVAFPDRSCSGSAAVFGPPAPSRPPESQKSPANGTGPRVALGRVIKGLRPKPHRLLGWVGADGYPMVVPVRSVEQAADRLTLTTPAGLVPDGARRAGLTGHAFTAGTLGQSQVVLTGWLENDGATVRYAPHTRFAYRIPPSRWPWRIVLGAATRIGLERARRDGVPSLAPRRLGRSVAE
ncbi:pyridoxamine 5'-phosphate oxidase [Nocardia tenerifensis]|uniref:Pyridoxamine 5'-phosphate oxidase n=1 Tax=Nocardia tenerifensis TaxID=228006 RepID=A0A318JUU2_9NOCA|nr:pyridoxamine 5'-phosphate oxidase family protein [Nocardia tenerifensis]PXX57932.1 pyridoxamine 5'-phosphate oxidase [Nocardia tenerifensis]